MKARLLHINAAFVALFVLVAVQQTRVQLMDSASINQRPGNPRDALSNEHRAALLDATGLPLAQSKGSRRVYPAAAALAQTVGYASSVYGESGLEAALDSVLSPRRPSAERTGAFAALFVQAQPASAARGGDVVLTLRRDVSAVVDNAMPAGVKGAVVVLDPRSGSILSAVNRPSFDPNRLSTRWKFLKDRTDAPLLDRAFNGLYPPGSTFKIVTASAALDSATFSVADTFYDPGYFDVNGFRIHNAEKEVTGTQSLTGAFVLSSNVDFAQIGIKLGTDTFYDYMHRFHLGEDPGLALPAARDELPQAASISQSELAQMAFGQGSLVVTPLRMALIAAAIANGGVMMRPQLIKQIQLPHRRPTIVPPVSWGRVVSADTAKTLRAMMTGVVRSGTGTAAALPGVTVAGKTGTATHAGGRPDAWFVCFAPADAPRLVVAVVVEDAGYGGAVSAPIARSILEGILPLYRH